jgi:hypothetical protein
MAPISYELNQTSRIAELEHKLHQLELVLGAKPDKVSRLASSLGTSSLLEAVQQLSTKAALLQPQQLDLIEARLANLIQKMDAIAQKSSGSTQDSAKDQKVSLSSVYEELFTNLMITVSHRLLNFMILLRKPNQLLSSYPTCYRG